MQVIGRQFLYSMRFSRWRPRDETGRNALHGVVHYQPRPTGVCARVIERHRVPIATALISQSRSLNRRTHSPYFQPSQRSLSGTAAKAKRIEGTGNKIQSTRYAIIVAKFNSLVTKSLLEGAREAFDDAGVPEADINIIWVPGSFELPLIGKKIATSGAVDAVVCIGAIIRGGTSHYDAVVNAATSGILRASMDSGIPCIFAVLTCDTMEQALDRAGGKMGNKGYEAAQTAIEMVKIMEQL